MPERAHYYKRIATPLDWNFTREDLADLFGGIDSDTSRDHPSHSPGDRDATCGGKH